MMNDFCQSALLALKSKKRLKFRVGKEINNFEAVTGGQLPSNNEIFTLISVSGGFSSLAIILSVAQKEKIEQIYCSTFRIGKEHFKKLYGSFLSGNIESAEFYTSDVQKKTDKDKYDYLGFVENICEETQWTVKPVKNHSKVILMSTAQGNHYVVETSSNLSENPKIEQFSVSNDVELFDFYNYNLFELLRNA